MREKSEGSIKVSAAIKYIEDNFPTSDKKVNEHLLYVRSLLKQSLREGDSEINIAKVYEAIHYIECIPLKRSLSFFSQPSMGQLMQAKKEIILPERERSQTPITLPASPKVSANSDERFGPIHKKLVEVLSPQYQFLKNEALRKKVKAPSIAWNYDYPLEENEVMNQAIGEWQNIISPLNNDAIKAHRDFMRDFSIKGVVPKTPTEIDDLLEYLLQGSSYSQQDRVIIKQWLHANGGQDINRFLDSLLISGEFTPEQTAALLNAKAIDQGWSIEKGKVVFFYEPIVYSMNIDGEIYVNSGRGGQLRSENDPEKIKDKSGNYRVPPLMKIRSQIELNVDGNGHVIPSITALNVQSYSPDLAMPKSQTLKESPRSM